MPLERRRRPDGPTTAGTPQGSATTTDQIDSNPCWWCGTRPRATDRHRDQPWSWCSACGDAIVAGFHRRRGPDDLHGARQLGRALTGLPEQRSPRFEGVAR